MPVLAHFARMSPRRVRLGFLVSAIAALVPNVTAATRPLSSGSIVPELLNPPISAELEETEVVLRWQPVRDGTEYVVFVSSGSLQGRSIGDLLAASDVRRLTTSANSVRLTEILRGDAGETKYEWAVAIRDAGTDELSLSRVSSFVARKRYRSVSSGEAALIRETRHGRMRVEAAVDGGSILLANGFRFDPLRDGEPPLVASLRAKPLEPNARGGFLVQLEGAVEDAQREALESAGASIMAYLPRYTYLVRMTSRDRDAVASLPFVRWVGRHQPAYKRSPLLETGLRSGPTEIVVLLYPDADLGRARIDLAKLGLVTEATDSGRNKIVRLRTDVARIDEIASRDDVAWVEPKLSLRLLNSNAQWVVQTSTLNDRRVWTMGLQGEGQVVHTSDSGIRVSHNQFRDTLIPVTDFGDYPTHRKVIAYKPTVPGVLFGDVSGASYHGTHTAGTLMGDDSPFALDLRDGMALKAKIYFHDGGADTNTIAAPTDLNIMFGEAYTGNAGGGARISSNSWSAATNGEYTVLDMTADQFMYDHKDMLIFFSTGNDGAPATVGSPATCKNGVGSGATQNGAMANLMMPLTSQGPTQDGRTKPTILSPGMSLSSANGAGDTGYVGLTGTSMSCPSKAGATTLIRQYYTDGWYPTGAAVPANAFTPSAALLKASAISSTDNDMTGFNIPNTTTGWGRINVDNVLFFPGDTERLAVVDESDGLATGEFVEYEIRVTDTSVPLKITLCWSDREGMPGALMQIVNDLDLVVTDPTSNAYLGNFFVAGQSATGGAADGINVEEGVRRNAPAAGVWTVRVEGNNVPFGPQPFAVAISGGIGANAGMVQIDRLTYGRDDVIDIRVEDLNASSPIQVKVSSTTESVQETVSIPGSGGVFSGTVPTTALEAMSGDGLLSVSHGDAIVVAYTDANPAATVSADATADFNGPIISNVGAAPSGAAQSVTWSTDILSNARVYYGATPALGQVSALDGTLTTTHAIALNGLLPETDYYFDVESADHTGNFTRDDRGGEHYRFTTDREGDILLVIGDDTFTAVSSYTQAAAARGWDLSILSGGTVTDPVVGNSSAGLRSKTAVWWQTGQEQYPPFPDAAQESLSLYLDGGGRLAVSSHDVAWAFTDPASGHHTPAREAWIHDYLHISWLEDPLIYPAIRGVLSDPISGSYVAGTPYVPHREGAAGDEVSLVPGTGAGSYIWSNTDATPDNIAIKWQNGANNGTPGVGVWGGTPTKLVTNCWEWAQLVDATTREDVFDKTLIWLIGNDHPDAAITAPNGGEVFTTGPVSIAWTEAAHGGASVASRALYYSPDAGTTWTLITNAPGPSPYSWNIAAVPNSQHYRIRVVLSDNGAPALSGADISNADFTVNRAGGDTQGPFVQAGSILMNPNPVDNRDPATLSAVVTDVGRGDSNIAAAEWSYGAQPLLAGEGYSMSGTFTSSTVGVTVAIPGYRIPFGETKIWVRARDAAGTWGNATAAVFRVNGDPAVDAPEVALPARFALEQNAPNPFADGTAIRFALPQRANVNLCIYNVQGQRVRTLLSSSQPAGRLAAQWDGRDDGGHRVGNGVYFYRLHAGDFEATRKMVLLK